MPKTPPVGKYPSRKIRKIPLGRKKGQKGSELLSQRRRLAGWKNNPDKLLEHYSDRSAVAKGDWLRRLDEYIPANTVGGDSKGDWLRRLDEYIPANTVCGDGACPLL